MLVIFQRRREFVRKSLLLTLTMLMLLGTVMSGSATVVSAHDQYGSGYPYRTSDRNCVWVRSGWSTSNHDRANNLTQSTQRSIAPPNAIACGDPYFLDAGGFALKVEYLKLNSSGGWDLCSLADWKNNNSFVWYMSYDAYFSGGNPAPCGSGTYKVRSWGFVWNEGIWQGGSWDSGTHTF